MTPNTTVARRRPRRRSPPRARSSWRRWRAAPAGPSARLEVAVQRPAVQPRRVRVLHQAGRRRDRRRACRCRRVAAFPVARSALATSSADGVDGARRSRRAASAHAARESTAPPASSATISILVPPRSMPIRVAISQRPVTIARRHSAAPVLTTGASCSVRMPRGLVRCQVPRRHLAILTCHAEPPRRRDRARTCSSTPTIPWTGIPWGDEAFAQARARRQADLPVDRLLHLPLVPRDGARVVRERRRSPPSSIATSSSIKVDREERPDVDRVYMTFVQATTGSGGWPMSVWLTPELKPFYGGTYFPADCALGQRPGFVDVLQRDRARRGETERAKVVASAAALDRSGCEALGRARSAAAPMPGDRRAGRGPSRSSRRPSTRGTAASATRRSSRARASCCSCCASTRAPGDRRPRATWCCTRCGRWRSAGCATTSAAASTATRWTATGACRTSRRCSTTRRSSCWRYLEAAQVTGDPFFATVADDTLAYVARDMTDAGGRVLLGRGRRQHPAGAGRRAGRRTRWKARSTSGRATRSRRCSATMPRWSRARFGIEPDGNAPFDPQRRVHRQEPALHGAVDRGRRGAVSGRPADESCTRRCDAAG